MTAIAIDFGTSNTVVSLLEPDTQQPKTLRFPGISRLFKLTNAKGEVQEIPVVPSLVFVKGDQWAFGEQVRSQRLGLAQPDRLFKAFKRDLVADFQPPPRYLDDQTYTVETVSERFLQHLWEQIQQQAIAPSQVIFTIPVGAFERYLDWFRQVAETLGIPEVRLIDESTAAALGYAVQHPGSLVLVVDWGGGTLDLSLVRTAATTGSDRVQQAEVLAKSDAYVGGEDIDQWIVEDYLRQIGSSRAVVGAVGWQNLLAIAERLKIRLSGAAEAKESWLDEETFTAYDISFSRDRLEEILETQQFLEHLRQALDDVLAIALSKGIHKSDIEQVLLVGGSCLVPAVQQLVLSYFGRQRVKFDKPFEAIAHGALALTQLADIDDYLHHTYAIRLWEPYTRTYSYFPLFERGTRYPCQRAESLTLQVATPGQHEIRLDIGEVADIAQAEVSYDAQGRMTSSSLNRLETYRSLESNREEVCIAHLDPPGQTGIDRLSVKFEVNEERVLVATIRDLLTDKLLLEKGAIAKLK
ncbi:Hsp70 family protein [Oscillatoria sp. FACHB-1407]|uniref:Hsp70 family protein n=1 Tax=Oscillatoria sp. FACHB-1407 TaxID=2692847 RepID=UPI00168537F0|nr:Hsp70 family protein [Oscillatoria sp. FACHB-1407]MBD2460554.1 Hsp70 family protein [Oscillatoria sp. FACHB-1407]